MRVRDDAVPRCVDFSKRYLGVDDYTMCIVRWGELPVFTK